MLAEGRGCLQAGQVPPGGSESAAGMCFPNNFTENYKSNTITRAMLGSVSMEQLAEVAGENGAVGQPLTP